MTDAKTILVVDDDHDLLTLISQGLTNAGYRVMVATDGEHGLQAATKESRPDLIITDVDMPEMDGLSMTRSLKALPFMRSVPIILLTNQQRTQDVIAGINAGARHYVVKPFKMENLLAKVAQTLG